MEASPSPPDRPIAVRRLACPVRACGQPLAREGRAFVCPRAHSFDVAKSGYVNLMQPGHSRSRQPGDARAAVEARVRLAEAGVDLEVVHEVVRVVGALALPRGAGGLDVGCGPGIALGALAGSIGIDGYGVDLSTVALRAAARRHPDLLFAAANADYRLPFADGALDLVVSVKGPKNPSEFARVLAPGGHLVLAVPGADDLAELRRATAGAALERDPAARALELHREKFELVRRTQARERIELAQGVLDDLLLASYRGARHREAERARELASLDVTLAAEVLVLRRLPGEPGVG